MLEEGQAIITEPELAHSGFGDTDSARHRNFSQGNVDLKGRKHFEGRPTATWNSEKVGRSMDNTRAGQGVSKGRACDAELSGVSPSVYEISDRKKKTRETLPSQPMEAILTMKPRPANLAQDGFAHKGKGPQRKQRSCPSIDSKKVTALLAPEAANVDDAWGPVTSTEKGLRRMDLSHNTEKDDAKRFEHERFIPTWDSENVKQDIQPDGYNQDWNDSTGVRTFMFSTGTETADGRWAHSRYGNRTLDSRGFEEAEQASGAPKLSFSYGTELDTDRWVHQRNTDTWGGEIANHGWGDAITNTKIYKEETERVRFHDTWKNSEPLMGVNAVADPIVEPPTEVVHNMGVRHPKRDNPTFNSQILARSNEAQKESQPESTQGETGVALLHRDVERHGRGMENHYGNSARDCPTFASSGLVQGQASESLEAESRRGGISNHLQGGSVAERFQPTYDSRKLEKNLIDAGDTQKRLYDTQWDGQRHGSQVDAGGPVSGTHQKGYNKTGKRVVPTFNSEKASIASFRRGSPPKRPAQDSRANPRHTAHVAGLRGGKVVVGRDRIDLGTLG